MVKRPPDAAAAIRAEWREHWRVGVSVMFAAGFGYTVWPSVSSMFVEPLQRSFGWSRGQIAFTYYGTILASLLAPGLGMLIDRVGARLVLLVALAVVAICYGLLAALPAGLWTYYAVSAVAGLAGMGTSGISTTRIVNGTFSNTRGFALAATRAGLAISAALLPPLLFAVINLWSFRAGFATLGLLVVLMPLPLGWLWFPRREVDASPRLMGSPGPFSSSRLLITDRRVLCLCLAAAFNYAPVFAILSQLKPLGAAKALTEGTAVLAVSIAGLASFGGAIVSGLLVDRLWAPGVAFGVNILGALGCLLLTSHAPGPLVFVVGIALIGFGQGAEIDIVAYIIARWHGMASYGFLFGLTALTIALIGSIGAMLIAIGYDTYGNYQLALVICSGSFCLAALLYLSLGRPPLGVDLTRSATLPKSGAL
ncbi:MFS transporter [Sphingomonas sp.]|uniref:MFS transporter n=1 Tax=Sphingomonas sp. TaxID=28214 RepID=UPI003B00EDEB